MLISEPASISPTIGSLSGIRACARIAIYIAIVNQMSQSDRRAPKQVPVFFKRIFAKGSSTCVQIEIIDGVWIIVSVGFNI